MRPAGRSVFGRTRGCLHFRFAEDEGVLVFRLLFRAGLSETVTCSVVTGGTQQKDQQMQKQSFAALTLIGALFIPTLVSAQFADSVVSYTSGTGFQPGYNSPASALGEPSRVTPGTFGGPVDPFNAPYLSSQLVSLGLGGSLTVQFNSPILNHPANPFGLDFNVFGNAGFVITNAMDENWNYLGTPRTDGSLYGADAATTRVSVSSDGINFFTLNPTLAPTVDGLFPTDGSGDFGLPMNPALNGGAFVGLDLAGIRSLYNGSSGGIGFDIAWAQDGSGNGVSLTSISFVRVEVLAGKAEIDGFAVVPEPASAALLLLGSLAVWAQRRHRH